MKLTIKMKLIVFAFVLLAIPSFIIGIVGHRFAKSELDTSGKTVLKNTVYSVIQMIDVLDGQVKKGSITLEEAQEKVRVYLLGPKGEDGTRSINKNIDLGENGYVLAYTADGYETMHPRMEGQYGWDLKTKDGFYPVRDQIRIAQNGGGYYSYLWALPDNPNKIVRKISYNQLEPHWGWIISAGSYMSDYNNGANKVFYVFLITFGASLLVGAFGVLFFSQHISRPIVKITEHVNKISRGDLKVDKITVKNADETGVLSDSINLMTDNLRAMIYTISNVSGQVGTSSAELSAIGVQVGHAAGQVGTTVQDIALGAQEQARLITNTGYKIKSLLEQINKVNHEFEGMSQAASVAAQRIDHGSHCAVQSIRQMENIRETVSDTSRTIGALAGKSMQVENMVEVISDISDRTNLLALNAAIEAARAGEAGKGFSVVAGEVRKLAEATAKATKDITSLLQEIKNDIAESSAHMAKSVGEVDNGVETIKNTGEVLQHINQVVNSLIGNLEGLRNNTRKMTAASEAVADDAEHIASISEEFAASAEEVAATSKQQIAATQGIAMYSKQLDAMVNELAQHISKFKL